jgi:hypothetical protein
MTDKELLELAAKAAGIEIKWDTPYKAVWDFAQVPNWNPLTDDGDALRLAVRLQIHMAKCLPAWGGEVVVLDHEEPDPYAATRRCITRAVAAIGKEMP